MSPRMSENDAQRAAVGAALGVIVLIVLMFIAVLDPVEPGDADGLLPPLEQIPVHLSGTVTGPCFVLSTIEYGDFEDSAGRKVGDAYLYGPLNGVEKVGDSCTVEFDTLTTDGVPRLERYVIRVGDLYAEFPLPDEPPAGYVGSLVLTEQARP